MKVNGKELVNVYNFQYLWLMLYNDGNGIKEIKLRLNMALQKLKQMTNM